MFVNVRTAILAALVACPSYAETAKPLPSGPDPQAKIIGNGYRPERPHSILVGYNPVKSGYWYNPAQQRCLRISVQDGEVLSVTEARAAICGLAVQQRTGQGAGCPMGSTPADHALYPDCRNIMAGR